MLPQEFARAVLAGQPLTPQQRQAKAFAPINIALCKYWGKRDSALNLPLTSSLSIGIPTLGTQTQLTVIEGPDQVFLNHELIEPTHTFSLKIKDFIDLFRAEPRWGLKIETQSDVPVAAGLASSASGFAALTLALAELFNWQLEKQALSLLARLGSGSATRSLWPGFVYWERGESETGWDSYAYPLPYTLPSLCVGLLVFHNRPKTLSSRIGMERTVKTSSLYEAWPNTVAYTLREMEQALQQQDLDRLGQLSEQNALAMHATMQAAWPPVVYSSVETWTVIEQIWALRQAGHSIYFTQDAGPHLKLIFPLREKMIIETHFPTVQIIKIF